MAIQTDYKTTLTPAVVGTQATMVPATIVSRNVEEPDGLAFGVPVSQGANENGVIAFAGDIVGITLLDRSAMGDVFPRYSSARVMTEGDIWVTASVAVAAGDDVYVTPAGAFTNIATSNTAIAGARWDTSTTAAGLAVVRLS